MTNSRLGLNGKETTLRANDIIVIEILLEEGITLVSFFRGGEKMHVSGKDKILLPLTNLPGGTMGILDIIMASSGSDLEFMDRRGDDVKRLETYLVIDRT
jgi:hypothetical protein